MRSPASRLALLLAGPAFAAYAGAADASGSLTSNVGVSSQYVFRGLAQTNERPALQGGADYAHASGLYAGTWLSNISWFSDTNAGTSASLEWDLYGGFRKTWNGGLTSDVGYLRYQYPGSYPDLPVGTVEPDTDEVYLALGWKWASLKYSYAFSDVFGVENSDGSDYLDLTITVPVTEKLSLAAHAGRQRYTGASTAARLAGTNNDALYTYEDYRATATYAFAENWSALATYTHTNARDAGYTVRGRNLGDDQLVIGLTRTF